MQGAKKIIVGSAATTKLTRNAADRLFTKPSRFTHSLHKLQGEIQNSQALPIPKTIGNLLVGIHLR
jgi:hypothetical protein